MDTRLIAILSSLSISPALLFSNAENAIVAKTECIAKPKNAPCMQPKMAKKVEEERSCGLSPRSQRVEVKHIESKGVGYKTGYSSLEGFFTIPSLLDGSWFPFLDIRGHIFNDGKPAVNGGLGLRYLGDTRVWGANVYYDYRETHHRHYNQVGGGLETLGKIWDFRVNAYIPVGRKDSHLFHSRFHEFKHHSIILKSKKEIAMKGANAEVGAHALRKHNYQLYAATGPYYFEKEGRVAWGGEGRLVFTAFDYLRLQLSGSYDKIFKGIVQGEVALTYSFGGKKTIKSYTCNDCDDRKTVVRRAFQRVDRNEIIVVDRKRQKTKAIDPATGDPYTVWFVDNTSHSQGTFESPFNTLLDAQNASDPNDIIYVFPGDGTDTGMNSGIILKKGQQLLGAGIGQQIETTRGIVNVRAHAKGMPMISNTFASKPTAVYMNQGDNVVSGLMCVDNLGGGTLPTLTDESDAMRIDGGLNYLIKNNIVSTFTDTVRFPASFSSAGGVEIFGGGNVTVVNNTFISRNGGATFALNVAPIVAPHEGYFVCKNNLFTGADANSGFFDGVHFQLVTAGVVISGPAISQGIIGDITVSIVNNRSASQANTQFSTRGILVNVTPNAENPIRMKITGNNVDIPSGYLHPQAGMRIAAHGPGPLIVSLHDNVSLTTPPTPGYLFQVFNNQANMQLDFGYDNFGTSTGP